MNFAPLAIAIGAALLAQHAQPPQAPQSQPPQAPPQQQPPAQPQQGPRQPWFVRIGLRSIEVQAKLPPVDQVVLVPDEQTYLEEVGRWTLQARWPVLIEDSEFAPRFIRAFKPSAVFRRASVLGVGAPPAQPLAGDALKARIEGAIAHAWDGKPGDTPLAAMQAKHLVPAGIVGASVRDPAWTAAVALAAGRGQPIAWLDGDFATLGAVQGPEQFAVLDTAVTDAFKATGLTWDALGDDLETFTLCTNYGMRVTLRNPPGGWDSRLPPRDDAPVASTDALCRLPSGKRYAFAAQVPGDSMRAAYIAMCSLFLSRSSFWIFDGYAGRTDEMFAQFGFAKTANDIKANQWALELHEGSNASAASWKAMLPVGVSADVIMVNSAGNNDFFQLGTTDNLWSTAIPVLNQPSVLSMVHSFSLQSADSPSTIGWRWLEHGAYAYVGSVHEPYLVAFIRPQVMLQRALSMAPFLIASRNWEGDLIPQAWRVATLGDPLMTIPPAELAKHLATRLPADRPPEPKQMFEPLREVARAAMEATRAANDPATYATAMRALVLLGDDKIAAQLWAIAASKGQGAAVAADALGPLYRMRQRDAFMDAWPQVAAPTANQRDMLWGLWSGALGPATPKPAVMALRDAVRTPRADMDAEALVACVRRVEGKEAAALWLNQLIERETDVSGKRKLAELQGKL